MIGKLIERARKESAFGPWICSYQDILSIEARRAKAWFRKCILRWIRTHATVAICVHRWLRHTESELFKKGKYAANGHYGRLFSDQFDEMHR